MVSPTVARRGRGPSLEVHIFVPQARVSPPELLSFRSMPAWPSRMCGSLIPVEENMGICPQWRIHRGAEGAPAPLTPWEPPPAPLQFPAIVEREEEERRWKKKRKGRKRRKKGKTSPPNLQLLDPPLLAPSLAPLRSTINQQYVFF